MIVLLNVDTRNKVAEIILVTSTHDRYSFKLTVVHQHHTGIEVCIKLKDAAHSGHDITGWNEVDSIRSCIFHSFKAINPWD